MAKVVWNVTLQLTDDGKPEPLSKKDVIEQIRYFDLRHTAGLKVSKVKAVKVSK